LAQVETCLECSAKKMINIAEVHSPFNSAHAPNDMRSVPKHFVQEHRPGHTPWFLKFCSAPRGSLTKVMAFSTKAVLHPTAALYDTRAHVLVPACERALRRIFALSDVDEAACRPNL